LIAGGRGVELKAGESGLVATTGKRPNYSYCELLGGIRRGIRRGVLYESWGVITPPRREV